MSRTSSEEELPDQVIESVNVTGAMTPYADPTVVDVAFSGNTVLQPGKSYWLAAFPGQADTAAIWHFNYDPVVTYNAEYDWYDLTDRWKTGEVAWFNGIHWQLAVPTEPALTQPPNDALNAFEIIATPIPEPAVAGVALLLLLSASARRRP